jgi:hypothetical protein
MIAARIRSPGDTMAEKPGIIRRVLRKVARAATAPMRNYVNRQFTRVEASWERTWQSVQDWRPIQDRLLEDIQTASELTAAHARSLTLLTWRLDQLNERLDQLNQRLDDLPESVATAVRGHPGETDGQSDAAEQRASRKT